MVNIINGFYIIKDKFFTDISDQLLVDNKNENRPHYYCFKDDLEIIWIIPVTSQKDKIIENKKKNEKRSEDLFHYLKIGHKISILLIANMFPITEDYIKREYTISNKPFRLLNKKEIKIIDKKARRILALLKKGFKFTPKQLDVLKIESYLKSKILSK